MYKVKSNVTQVIPAKFYPKGNLEKIIGDNDVTIYSYILTTVKYNNEKGIFQQHGSSPNFEGGAATLTCCKHRMRTYPNVNGGVWIAGFTHSNGAGKNYLFYLAQIERAVSTFSSLANYIGEAACSKKDSRKNRLGDIYVVKGTSKNPFDAGNYFEPCDAHVHKLTQWEEDISYTHKGIHPRLIVFDKRNTFVWEKPIYCSSVLIGRGEKKFDSKEKFIKHLQPAHF